MHIYIYIYNKTEQKQDHWLSRSSKYKWWFNSNVWKMIRVGTAATRTATRSELSDFAHPSLGSWSLSYIRKYSSIWCLFAFLLLPIPRRSRPYLFLPTTDALPLQLAQNHPKIVLRRLGCGDGSTCDMRPTIKTEPYSPPRPNITSWDQDGTELCLPVWIAQLLYAMIRSCGRFISLYCAVLSTLCLIWSPQISGLIFFRLLSVRFVPVLMHGQNLLSEDL